MPDTNLSNLRPFEVFTTIVYNGVANRFLNKYIVGATSATEAMKKVALDKDEEVVTAREMVDYELVL